MNFYVPYTEGERHSLNITLAYRHIRPPVNEGVWRAWKRCGTVKRGSRILDSTLPLLAGDQTMDCSAQRAERISLWHARHPSVASLERHNDYNIAYRSDGSVTQGPHEWVAFTVPKA